MPPPIQRRMQQSAVGFGCSNLECSPVPAAKSRGSPEAKAAMVEAESALMKSRLWTNSGADGSVSKCMARELLCREISCA